MVNIVLISLLTTVTEYDEITVYVKDFVQHILPGKKITPISFRRMVASMVFSKELHTTGKTKEDFLRDYAVLINTSTKVNLRQIELIVSRCWKLTTIITQLRKKEEEPRNCWKAPSHLQTLQTVSRELPACLSVSDDGYD